MTKQIVLFHTFASFAEITQQWKITFKGWVHEQNSSSRRHRIYSSVSRRLLKPFNGGSPEVKLTFEERTKGFLAKPIGECKVNLFVIGSRNTNGAFKSVEEQEQFYEEEFKTLDLTNLTTKYPTCTAETDKDGFFEVDLILNDDFKIDSGTGGYDQMLLCYASATEEVEDGSFGLVPFVEQTGISVISDVDDTIKKSNVFQGMLTAVKVALFNEHEDIPGMADAYNFWALRNIAFHYVSSSPYQLYPVLEAFLGNFKFPHGSLSLRNTSKEKSKDYKHNTILGILDEFPNRKFILVGDSGEKDIEIYNRIAMERPSQILRVYIRDVGNNQEHSELLKRADDHSGFVIFRDPMEITSDYVSSVGK